MLKILAKNILFLMYQDYLIILYNQQILVPDFHHLTHQMVVILKINRVVIHKINRVVIHKINKVDIHKINKVDIHKINKVCIPNNKCNPQINIHNNKWIMDSILNKVDILVKETREANNNKMVIQYKLLINQILLQTLIHS